MTAVRRTGLVVGATDPIDNKLRLGNRNRGWVRVIADLGGKRVMAVNRFDLTPKRWLVVGMEVSVRMDPGTPCDFEIVWAEIPSMEVGSVTQAPARTTPAEKRSPPAGARRCSR